MEIRSTYDRKLATYKETVCLFNNVERSPPCNYLAYVTLFQDLPQFFHESKVERLTEDSSNVVELVKGVYLVSIYCGFCDI